MLSDALKSVSRHTRSELAGAWVGEDGHAIRPGFGYAKPLSHAVIFSILSERRPFAPISSRYGP
ncbi:MAG: hypothetical protein M3305_09025 [Actinomycetota bacterium]|nr:hypothetical protein [Actinomycetota bacterium]